MQITKETDIKTNLVICQNLENQKLSLADAHQKKVLSKISQITQEKHPCWSFPSTKYWHWVSANSSCINGTYIDWMSSIYFRFMRRYFKATWVRPSGIMCMWIFKAFRWRLRYLQIRMQFSRETLSESFKMFKFSKRLDVCVFKWYPHFFKKNLFHQHFLFYGKNLNTGFFEKF